VKRADETYRSDTLSPQKRFGEVETTISHLFRAPHVALAGRSYGHALFDALSARGMIPGRQVTEIGGGTGDVAAAMIAASGDPPLRWRFVDLSPALLAAQRARVPAAESIQAHAESLPFEAGALGGLLLANEVIADLHVAPARSEEAARRIERYQLDVRLDGQINVGALRLIEELARVLAKGATACLTEFGGDFDIGPVELGIAHKKARHTEFSIRFDHLARAAHSLGFSVDRALLCDLLDIDRKVQVTSYPDLVRLRRFNPRLPVLAHPREAIEKMHPWLTRFFEFEFPEIGSPIFPNATTQGGFCQVFHALLLRR
jgi:SAM-dependent methyltransferase